MQYRQDYNWSYRRNVQLLKKVEIVGKLESSQV
jgi:hypothetical protein